MTDQQSGNPIDYMRDHDILVALHGKVETLVETTQNLADQIQLVQNTTYNEFKSIAIAQTKTEVEIGGMKSETRSLADRVDKLDSRWKVGDIVTGVAAIIAGAIGWFR